MHCYLLRNNVAIMKFGKIIYMLNATLQKKGTFHNTFAIVGCVRILQFLNAVIWLGGFLSPTFNCHTCQEDKKSRWFYSREYPIKNPHDHHFGALYQLQFKR